MTTSRVANEHRAALGRAVGLGLALLPLFVPLDIFIERMLYPEADLGAIFALRAAACLAAALAWWIARTPRFSERTARIAHAACLALIAVTITGMANELGGPTSVYIHGLSVIIMVRSATVPAPSSMYAFQARN